MKLLHITTFRLSAITALVLAFWSFFFYITIVREMNDELDDSLEDYAELVIRRHLKGEKLPTKSWGSNNQYFLQRITPAQAQAKPHITHTDRQVYIDDKNEWEPARVISYIFQNYQGEFYEIEVSTPTIDRADLKESIFWSLLILYISILISIFLINLWTIKYTMRPLHKLLHWLQGYQLNKTNEPLQNNTKIEEFKSLNEGVGRAMQRNEEVYNQQRMFIGNASHELQTPLAVAINRLEMMLENEQLSEAEMSNLIKIRQTLTSMSKLNRSLLLLSRIENQQFAERTPINLNEQTRQLLDDFKAIYAHQSLTVELHEAAPFIALTNEVMASALLTNLIKNAFIHNRQQGTVRVTTQEQGITVMNTGSEKPLDTTKIFAPFYHEGQHTSSTGLGLALAKTICEQSGWQLIYNFQPPFHCFEVIVKNR